MKSAPQAIDGSLPEELAEAVAARAAQARGDRIAGRIWDHDESLWGGPGVPEIGNRLGWLTIADEMAAQVGDLRDFANACHDEGLRDAVLLGMGGSSLAPEVFRQSFGARDGALRLHVLDSTDAGAVIATGAGVDLERTLFIVSTKSGGTIETLSLFKHFHARLTELVDEPGRHFVAITDPGSPLVELADENAFRRTFLANPEIGGRYSALSHFGLVPAALAGIDIAALLEGARQVAQACAGDDPADNPGLWLGLCAGELALRGRDKVTFVVDEPIASFGLWVEQLIAESTGKHGRGIVPVASEPVGDPPAYGEDRLFIHLRRRGTGASDALDALARAGHPTLAIDFDGAEDLGRVMFGAEFATAVAGWVLGINPFDQPNVQEAKDNTNKVLAGYARDGSLPAVENANDAALDALLQRAEPPHYFAVMAYVEPSEGFEDEVASLRRAVRDATRATTTFGYGPRFQHSTGQLHKGGPPIGVFLQLVHDGEADIEVPGAGYGFTTLKNAQATGDIQTLRAHGLPAERVRLEGDEVAALAALRERIEATL